MDVEADNDGVLDIRLRLNRLRELHEDLSVAVAAIQDQAYARENWWRVKGERQRVSDELTQMGWTVLPSAANFVFAASPGGRGLESYLGLKQQGILVRHFDKPGLKDKIRITIGRVEENNALLAGVKALSAAGKAA